MHHFFKAVVNAFSANLMCHVLATNNLRGMIQVECFPSLSIIY